MAARTTEKPNIDDPIVEPPAESAAEQKKREKRAAAKRKGKGGKPVGLIVLFTILGLLLLFAVAIYLDLFGLRTAITNNVLVKIPIVGSLVKQEEPARPDPTLEELQAEYDALQTQADTDTAELLRLRELNASYLKELDRLKDIEDRHLQFKEDKEAFDKMVAADNLKAFAQFYETMDPANAEAIYREYARNASITKEMRDYVATYTAMDEANAAKTLEQLAGMDIDLVVRILLAMDAESRGTIMNEMTPQSAANIGRRMAPSEQISE